MAEIIAPWTVEQVDTLNAFQVGGFMHPFTCGRRDKHRGHPSVLLATPAGWVCTQIDCTFTQDWAHDFMADRAWVLEQTAKLSDLFGKRS
jgi:hypothetical protein